MSINPPYRFDPLQNPVDILGDESDTTGGAGDLIAGAIAGLNRVFVGRVGCGTSYGTELVSLSSVFNPLATVSGHFAGDAASSGEFDVDVGKIPYTLDASLGGLTLQASAKDNDGSVVAGPFFAALGTLVFTGTNGHVYTPSSATAGPIVNGEGGLGDSAIMRVRIIMHPDS